MTKRDLAVLGCKILGLFIFIRYIPLFLTFIPFSVGTYLQGDLSGGDIFSSVLQALMGILVMASGAGFWFLAKRIAQRMIPEDTPPASFTLHEDFIMAALLLIGVVLLVVSIPVCIRYFAEHLFAPQNTAASNPFQNWDLIEAYFQFILGIIILGSSTSISRHFRCLSKSTFLEQETQITKHDIAYLGCRLLGIYFIVINTIALISQLGMSATRFFQQNNGLLPIMVAGQIESVFYFLIFIAIGFWLWLGANSFARKLTGKNSSDAADLNLAILPLLISFVGLMLLVRAVPGFINDLSLQYMRSHYFSTSGDVFVYGSVAAGVKVLLGILLFFASGTVSDKLQNLGSSSASATASLKSWIKNPSGSRMLPVLFTRYISPTTTHSHVPPHNDVSHRP